MKETKEEERQRKLAELFHVQWAGDLKAVLSTLAGQRFFMALCYRLGALKQSYKPGATDTAFEEGRRSAAVFLMDEALRVAPTEYVHAFTQALTSQRDEELRRQAAAARATNGDGDST